MFLPCRILAAGLLLCGTGLSCAALPLDSGATRIGANETVPAEWRDPVEKTTGDIGSSSVRGEAGFSRERVYRRHRHHRHHRHHRRGRHHHRFFFF
jgi:hypothetical protein